MSARWVLASILASPFVITALAGCSHARCDPRPVGDAWWAYRSLLPDDAVVCGPNRKSTKKPSDVVDDNPPTYVFVFYEETDPGAAFRATLRKLERAGWEVTRRAVMGKGKNAMFTGQVHKDGVSLRIVVNRNDWGTQGFFELGVPEP